MYDVLCTGLTCCDLIFANLEKFPELGKEVAGNDFLIKAGGAANTPMALAKLGINTLFTTAIGTDSLGEIVYEYMKNTGLDMSAVMFNDKFRTSVSAVLSIGHERGFASYFAECNYNLMENKIKKFVPSCRHIHTYIGDCLNMPVIEIAKKHGKTISVDTAWDENIRIHNIKNILKNCDVFLTNEVEACSITETDTPKEALEALSEYSKYVVVKLGSKGSIIKCGDRIIEVPGIKGINVVDTTGAGDLHGAGLVYGMLHGWSVEKTAKFASASGGLAVTFYGGMDEKYTLKAVLEYYNQISGDK